MTDQRMLFPEPAEGNDHQQQSGGGLWERTFAIDPQERASGFPFRKDSAAKEPLSRPIVLNTACDVVIC
jgi:hypothetical protein